MLKTRFDVGDSLREQGLRTSVNRFECAGCGKEASIIDAHAIAELVDHCMFDHVLRESIVAVTISEVANGYRVALEMGLDAQTDAEAEWRHRLLRPAGSA